MVLHIALDGIDGVGKSTMCEKLLDYFKENQYKTRLTAQPVNDGVLYILNNYNLTVHEKALLMAFDRSFSYYGENWEDYDIIIWDRSILSSYAYNTNNEVKDKFIKQINQFMPEMDLYIIIDSDEALDERDYTDKNINDVIHKYKWLARNHQNTVSVPYIKDDEDTVLKNIIDACLKNLPKCKWCPKIFKPSTKHKKYCSTECAEAAYEEQNRNNNINFFKKYSDTLTERRKGGLGSMNANLHGKADPNPLAELEKVRNAKRSLGL